MTMRWEPIGAGDPLSDSQQNAAEHLVRLLVDTSAGEVGSIGTTDAGELTFGLTVALVGDELPVAALIVQGDDGWEMSMHVAEQITLCEICGTAPAPPDQFHPVWHDDGAPMVACDRCVTADSEEDLRG